MGLFDKYTEPVFLKEDSEAEKQLVALHELQQTATGQLVEAIAREIKLVEAGIFGEKNVEFELKNSHIPMFVLHDLFLEHDGLTAQIDYLIVTRDKAFVIECKNLIGNIEINSNGDFIRTLNYGSGNKKEGMYSPITQNRRHLDLIKQIRLEAKDNWLSKTIFEKNFYNNYRSIVVLANPKTVVNMRYAKKEVRDQVIRADQLVSFIRKANDGKDGLMSEKNTKEIAEFFLSLHRPQHTDYAAKYREAMEQESVSKSEERPAEQSKATPVSVASILCPKCGAPMVKRTATKGKSAGKEFYGCSNFPKCRGIVNIDQAD